MTATPDDDPVQPQNLRHWIARRRRQIRFALILAVVAVIFFIIGATAPHVVTPYACRVYG